MAGVAVAGMTESGAPKGPPRAALADIATFSRTVVGRPLRPYQLEPARAVLDAVAQQRGLTIAVMVARQGGKNELSAQLEAYLLLRNRRRGGSLIKAAPTFRPQLITSQLRLEQVLSTPLYRIRWRREWSSMVVVGRARIVFLSADPSAQVVGATAHYLMEFDEAQDIDGEKHDRDFSPMGATTNCTRVYYGTAWDDQTLLQRTIEANVEAERRDGLRRNFIYPWWHVAECLPAYGRYVEAERERLGADHPLFVTQYELKVVVGAGGLFSAAQRAQLRGDHPRRRAPEGGDYVAAVDIAGEDEEAADAALRAAKPRKDSTVLLIGDLDREDLAPGIEEPRVRVVEAYWWTGRRHRELYPTLLDLLRDVWRVQRACVDASGIGAGVASFLEGALGETVCEQVVFSPARKSELGFAMLAAINGGRLKWWAADGSPEEAEFWHEVGAATYRMAANQMMRWSVPETLGHDDFVVALALLVRAAGEAVIAPAAAVLMRREDYCDGRY